MKSFIQGFLTPFSPFISFFPDDRPERTERRERRKVDLREIQMPRYADNIRGYWTNLGNYMTDVANGHEQKPSDS